jgi:SAM-dependent methyltransferase
MNNLYNSLSEVYEMMYHSFINYDKEYSYYSNKLIACNSKSVLELGCGTGNLAQRFIADGFDYTGIDLNKAMLKIAREKNPGADFLEADMRNFNLSKKKDACLMTGRTSAYLVTNKDVLGAFSSIHSNLSEEGIVCFDCIDTSKFIPLIANGKRIIHNAEFEKRKFQRESFWSLHDIQSHTFNWDSVYYEIEESRLHEIGKDNSIIRAFTKEDMTLMLEYSGFSVKEIEDRSSYAFDTFVITAQKNE